MKSTDDAQTFQRLRVLGRLARSGLIAAALIGTAMYVFPLGDPSLGAAIFALTSVAYFYLAWRSVAVTRDAMPAQEFLLRGDLPEAERLLTRAVRSFSLFPQQRQFELLQLARLRFLQSRFAESAALSELVTSFSPRLSAVAGGLAVMARLQRLEALLELGDLPLAYRTLLELGPDPATPTTQGLPPPGLGAGESARLLACRTRYECAVGAHDHVLYTLPDKVRLASLLPAQTYARWCIDTGRSAHARGRAALAHHLLQMASALIGSDEVSRLAGDLADAMSGGTSPAAGGRIA